MLCSNTRSPEPTSVEVNHFFKAVVACISLTKTGVFEEFTIEESSDGTEDGTSLLWGSLAGSFLSSARTWGTAALHVEHWIDQTIRQKWLTAQRAPYQNSPMQCSRAKLWSRGHQMYGRS